MFLINKTANYINVNIPYFRVPNNRPPPPTRLLNFENFSNSPDFIPTPPPIINF